MESATQVGRQSHWRGAAEGEFGSQKKRHPAEAIEIEEPFWAKPLPIVLCRSKREREKKKKGGEGGKEANRLCV